MNIIKPGSYEINDEIHKRDYLATIEFSKI